MKEHVNEGVKQATDALSIVTVVGTLMDLLPTVAALFTIVWTLIRIYETKTVQRWISRAKQK